MLIPRARMGSPILRDALCQGGISVLDVPVYDVEAEPVGREALLELSRLHYLTFESGSGVRGFFGELGDEKKRLLETRSLPGVHREGHGRGLKRLWDPAHEDRQGLYGRRPFISNS